ncbi:MAG: DUF4358 domain-containing protein [Oscillospiraceae bacterium]|nr:DUF4358 domain-containing protein [Oscillospiraceae bacterium]
MKSKAILLSLLLAACSAADVTADEVARRVCENAYTTEMEPVTDTYVLENYFGLDTGLDMAVYRCPAAAVMAEVIVIRTDDTDSALLLLESRRNKAIERDALYPDDKRRAEESLTGVTGDFAYFVMGEDADKAEDELLKAVNGR